MLDLKLGDRLACAFLGAFFGAIYGCLLGAIAGRRLQETEVNRAFDVAVAAWRHLRATGVEGSLVVVGGEHPPDEDGVVKAGQVDDHTWALLLAGAAAFCYPTTYEGFGMPALEAAASGTPVVCAPVGALPEVLGPAAAWCGSPTPEPVAAALVAVLVASALETSPALTTY